MDVKRRILRAGSVLAVALAAGHLVQSMKRDVPGVTINAATSGSVENPAGKLAQPDLVPTSASLTTGFGPSGDDAVMAEFFELTAPASKGDQPGCAASIALEVAPGAMINALVTAPCNGGERVVLRHAGMSFAARTSAEGTLRVRLPALETEAIVSVFFPDSEVVIGSVFVPDVANLQRFGLQWTASDVFDLRIVENDKIFVGGRAGRDPAGGQKITVLGDRTVDQAMFAEIYTFPADQSVMVDVVVEVAITPETCGRDLQPETILATSGTVTIEPQQVHIPDCGTAGDILVLKNLAPDVKIAVAN